MFNTLIKISARECKDVTLRDGDVLLFLCLSLRLFVRPSVVCEICEVIRYVAAPAAERRLIVSTPIHLLFRL